MSAELIVNPGVDSPGVMIAEKASHAPQSS
jgi:hypothetical protein